MTSTPSAAGPFQSPDPNFAARVRASFGRQQVMEHIGAILTEVTEGACIIRLPFRPELSQQHGFFHGGIVGVIADSAAGYAAYSLMSATDSVLTVEYKMNLLAPADGDLLLAQGQVVKPGRTLVVARAEVEVVKDGATRHCATMLATMMTMRQRSDSG